MAPPESTSHLRNILVPVDGSHASMQAVALACQIAKQNKGKVFVVHVIEVKRTLALTAELEPEETEGDKILTDAENVSKEQGFRVDGEILHARESGPAIVDEAIERAVDLIILGTGYTQPFGEYELGRVPEYVLKSAPCEVWLCRHPVEE